MTAAPARGGRGQRRVGHLRLCQHRPAWRGQPERRHRLRRAHRFVADLRRTIADGDGADYPQVTHQFLPSSTDDLYRVNVFIKNLTAKTIGDVVCRRLMDWDVEPTPFREYVTLAGNTSGPNGSASPYLRYTSNNGFASADPLKNGGFIGDSDVVVNRDFTQYGVNDHGALFDFTLGNPAAGVTQAFSMFYGASAITQSALASLSQVGAEIYSLAYASSPGGGGGGEPTATLPSLDTPMTGPGPAEGPDNSVFIFDFDVDNNGTSFENPALPNGPPGTTNTFIVPVQPGVPVVIDPFVAIGYDYTADFVRAFRISDIAVDLGLDPASPVAFATALVLDVSGPSVATITQTPISVFVAVPEPATWITMILGFGAIGAAARRTRRRTAAHA